MKFQDNHSLRYVEQNDRFLSIEDSNKCYLESKANNKETSRVFDFNKKKVHQQQATEVNQSKINSFFKPKIKCDKKFCLNKLPQFIDRVKDDTHKNENSTPVERSYPFSASLAGLSTAEKQMMNAEKNKLSLANDTYQGFSQTKKFKSSSNICITKFKYIKQYNDYFPKIFDLKYFNQKIIRRKR